jgi:exodeoxyribonuclease V gamma subunit
MALRPRPGDRSRKKDDKYLFLEALVSARQKLYISYIGKDIQDNSTIEPCVLVSELLDYLEGAYGVAADEILREHPLQAFSPRYFQKGSNLFSYSKENFDAVRAAQGNEIAPVFIKDALPAPPEAFQILQPGMLGRFFSNPVKFFLQKRLGIFLEDGRGAPDESERFNLEGLPGYQVGMQTLNTLVEGHSAKALRPLLAARGQLPPGRVGAHAFERIAYESGHMVSRAEAYTNGRLPGKMTISLQIDDFSIRGELSNVHDSGIVRTRFVKFSQRDLLTIWIDHLLLCAVGLHPQKPLGVYISKDATAEFDAVDNAVESLRYLLRLYRNGLTHPLMFFPKSAYAYAEKRIVNKADRAAALQAAMAIMQGGGFQPGEAAEPYIDFFLGGDIVLDEQFETIAMGIYEPFFKYYKKVEG